ncbi:AGAP003245-PA [Anopheles gambiae str. PEST]|uniref:CLIP domain-containing serine protease n=2 Tax=Anopheles gambiae TaxID=7165 RepID=A0NDA8_ANOGA|nr:CLIP domain-containing serine protease B4-like isoform X3 [Anopheles gambiae]XP_061497570.1 CLIP domain-containing serine protease B4-like isoform X3 [Anopheles gambiae]XP_061497571.1 CLIP domain-containing serine protease B4-like isoform X3 [Anopheles gambiae]EAU77020.2 AGAP003245-PA [Anopheles gambiae str. PEST]
MGQRDSNRSILWVFFTIIPTMLMADANQSTAATSAFCVNPAGDPGKCIYFLDCKPLPRALSTDLNFLKNSQCNQKEAPGFICCPDKRHVLPEPPHCGVRAATQLTGAQLTQPDDYPWTALIEYEKPDGTTGFHCGGTLINQGHILTAAHCVSSLRAGWKVHRVLLGEWDLSSVLDCAYNVCNNPPIEAKVSKIIVHDGYDAQNGSFNHDIALIRFEELANFPDTIVPICLPIADSIPWENITDGFSTVVGWGKSQSTAGVTKKLKLNLKVRNFRECSSLLEWPEKMQPSQLCALWERSNRKICSADAGGGLAWFYRRFHYLIGVAGSDEQKCGSGDVPGVFVNVSYYMNWIRDNIK